MSSLEILKKYLKYFIPIGILLIILFVLVLFFSIPRVSYKYDNYSNSYSVKSVYGNAKSYKIKSSYKNKDVTSIDVRAFYKKDIKKIIFVDSNNIEKIERLAFSRCKYLSDIDISNVYYFENNSFSYCESLKVEELNAIEIGMSSFYGCKSITNIKLNEGLNSIGSYAFSKTSIETLDLPKSLTMIYNDAFADMSLLKVINVYSNKLSIDSKLYLDSLEGIEVNYL